MELNEQNRETQIAKITIVANNYSSYYSIGCYTAGGGLVTKITYEEDNYLVWGFLADQTQAFKNEHPHIPIGEKNVSEMKKMGLKEEILSTIDRRIPVAVDLY